MNFLDSLVLIFFLKHFICCQLHWERHGFQCAPLGDHYTIHLEFSTMHNAVMEVPSRQLVRGFWLPPFSNLIFDIPVFSTFPLFQNINDIFGVSIF